MMAEGPHPPDSWVDGLGIAQRWVLIVSAVLLALALVVVPWEAEVKLRTEVRRPAGYSLVMVAPDPSRAFPEASESYVRNYAGLSVDRTRLAAQVAAVAVLGAVAFVLARNWDMRQGVDDG